MIKKFVALFITLALLVSFISNPFHRMQSITVSAASTEITTESFLEHLRGLVTTNKESTGEIKTLVFLVDFPDFPNDGRFTPEQVGYEYFDTGSPFSYPFESLNAYYQRSSYGQVSFTGNVYGWYRASHHRAYYETSTQLLEEVLAFYDTEIDFSIYDGNGDNYVDALYLNYTGWTSFDTPWWYYVENAGIMNYDDTFIGSYCFMNTSHLLHESTHITRYMPILTHETGHMLGLRDYYDTNITSNYWATNGGTLNEDMMDNTAGDHNSFSKMIMGWLDNPVIITQNTENIILSAFSTDPSCAVIFPYENNMDEFFVVEYWTLTKNNFSGIKQATNTEPGLRVWRINLNESGQNNIGNGVKMVECYQKSILVPNSVDSIDIHMQNLLRDGDEVTPMGIYSSYLPYFDETTNRVWGKFTGVSILNIDTGGVTASFDVTLSSEIPEEDVVFEPVNRVGNIIELKANREIQVIAPGLKPYITSGDQTVELDYFPYSFDSSKTDYSRLFLYVDPESGISNEQLLLHNCKLTIPAGALLTTSGTVNPVTEIQIGKFKNLNVLSESQTHSLGYWAVSSVFHAQSTSTQQLIIEKNTALGIDLHYKLMNFTHDGISSVKDLQIRDYDSNWSTYYYNQVGNSIVIISRNNLTNLDHIVFIDGEGAILAQMERPSGYPEFFLLSDETILLFDNHLQENHVIDLKTGIAAQKPFIEALRLLNYSSHMTQRRLFALDDRYVVYEIYYGDRIILLDSNLEVISKIEQSTALYRHNTLYLERTDELHVMTVTAKNDNGLSIAHGGVQGNVSFYVNVFDNDMTLLSQRKIYSGESVNNPSDTFGIGSRNMDTSVTKTNDGYLMNVLFSPNTQGVNSPYTKLLFFDHEFDFSFEYVLMRNGKGTLAQAYPSGDKLMIQYWNGLVIAENPAIEDEQAIYPGKQIRYDIPEAPTVNYYDENSVILESIQSQQVILYSTDAIHWSTSTVFRLPDYYNGASKLYAYAKYAETDDTYISSASRSLDELFNNERSKIFLLFDGMQYNNSPKNGTALIYRNNEIIHNDTPVAPGDEIIIQIIPRPGYRIESVLLNDMDQEIGTDGGLAYFAFKGLNTVKLNFTAIPSHVTIAFNSQGGSEIASITVGYNTIIEAPTAPIRAGYTFGGWYKEADCLDAWNPTDTVVSDMTLYAKWTKNYITGDATGDGKVDALDLLIVKKHLLGQLVITGDNALASDVTGDERIDALDLLKIKKYLLGQITL